MNKFLKSFPGKPRHIQTDALEKIDKALKKNKKFIILCAPTGSGKSHISAAIALSSKPAPQKFINLVDNLSIYEREYNGKYSYESEALACGYHRTMVCTVTKALQDQYDQLFKDNTIVFKGKTNYQCNVDPNMDCDTAPCVTDPKLKQKCMSSQFCNYYNTRDDALKNNFSTLNYSSFFHLPPHTKQIEYLICDEASELEAEIVKYFTVEINYKTLTNALKKTKINKLTSESSQTGHAWLKELNNTLLLQQDIILNQIGNFKKSKNNSSTFSEIRKFKYIKSLQNQISVLLKNWFKIEVIIECKHDSVSFTPLYVNNLTKDIFDSAKNVILMSATIIDPVNFAKTLGIDNYEYIEVDNTFDPKKSPIFCSIAKYNLNYKNINNNLPKVIKQIDKICNHYGDKKGLIHTHTHKITESIQNKFKNNKRFIYREPGINNEEILNLHSKRKDSTVIVSPSLTFGTDLPDDLGRFQIIVKLPYPSLGSKRIKTLFDRDKTWYIDQMLNVLVQSVGRCTRHVNDFSETFILDGQIIQVLKTNWHRLPQYFKNRIH
jgi:Rad3-related DNA helicase